MEDRFWSKVATSQDVDACWEWKFSRTPLGYGQHSIKRRTVSAHRVAYALAFGDPGSRVVRHKCDNPPCCNPWHLLPGTQLDNVRDRNERGRTARGPEMHRNRDTARGERCGHYTKPECTARGDRNGARTKPHRICRGERHGMTKLSDQQVESLVARFNAGGVTKAALAREFGVSDVLVGMIVRGSRRLHPPKHDTAPALDDGSAPVHSRSGVTDVPSFAGV